MDSQALQALADAVRLWEVDPAGCTEHLVTTGAEWAEPSGSASARALGQLDEDASRTRVRELALALRDELRLTQLEGSDVQDEAVAAMCRRHLAGEVSARELTYWIWRVVGLKGSERCRPFLQFEDEYTRYAAYDCSAIDNDVTAAAEEFVHPGGPKRRSRLAKFFRRG